MSVAMKMLPGWHRAQYLYGWLRFPTGQVVCWSSHLSHTQVEKIASDSCDASWWNAAKLANTKRLRGKPPSTKRAHDDLNLRVCDHKCLWIMRYA